MKRLASEEESVKEREKNKRRIAAAASIRHANKQLLGELHFDQMYLQRLLSNPMLNKPDNSEKDLEVKEAVRGQELYDSYVA